MLNRFKSLALAAFGLFANPTYNFVNPQSGGSWLSDFAYAFTGETKEPVKQTPMEAASMRNAAANKRECKALKRLDNQRRAKSHQLIDVTSRAMRLKECPVNV